jgi:hypothetical protein
MIATVVQDGDQHAAFFRLGVHSCIGLIEVHAIRPPLRTDLSSRHTAPQHVRLTIHEPPACEENNANSPAMEATTRLTLVELQQFIAGLAALERQLRGAV